MMVALLMFGIVSGLGSSAFALLSGYGILAAIAAYVLGGMGGMIVGILATLPFAGGSGPDAAPARVSAEPTMA